MVLGNIILHSILQREQTNLLDPIAAQNYFSAKLQGWELKSWVLAIKPSGSHAKGTAIKSSADVDLFISINSACPKTLQEIYDSLASFLTSNGETIRKQNVSIRCSFTNGTVDLVPAKQNSTSWLDKDHWLCVRKRSSRQKTNIDTHIDLVKSCGHTDVIKLVKAWREKKKFEFPSLHIELVVIEALKGRHFVTLEDRLKAVLAWIAKNIEGSRFVDPANTNNVISDDLTNTEKQTIRKHAELAILATNWQGVF